MLEGKVIVLQSMFTAMAHVEEAEPDIDHVLYGELRTSSHDM
jgi:hypothetical protein